MEVYLASIQELWQGHWSAMAKKHEQLFEVYYLMLNVTAG